MRGRIWLSFVVLAIGALLFGTLLDDGELTLALRILQASASAGVVYCYARAAYFAFRVEEPIGSDYLIVGILLSFFSMFCQAIYSIVYRLLGGPTWMLYSEVAAPFVLISVIAAVLHVTAPGAVDGRVPPKNRITVGICFAIAVACVLTLAATRERLMQSFGVVEPTATGSIDRRR